MTDGRREGRAAASREPHARFVVAIDGPSGAGKGTVARAVAQELGCLSVDTGAMYRAVAWACLERGVPLDDEARVARLAASAEFDLTDGVRIDGQDVTAAIRTARIDAAAARVARLPEVRSLLVARQRRYADAGTVVMEGRDIGTVVFPDAAVKIFLDASPEERARRRAADGARVGDGPGETGAVAVALEARDRSDRTRTVSPLTTASDAIVVDTSDMPVAAVVARVLEVVRERWARSGDGEGR